MKWLLAALLGGWIVSASATDASVAAPGQTITPATEQMVRQAVGKLSADAQVDSIQVSPMPGFYQVIASGQMLYVSTDGKYLLNGDLLDLGSMHNASKSAWAQFRRAELAKVPASQRIVFAPPHPKYTVTVFSDVTCGYCRALHEQIAAFNRAGIAVEYLAWPREGIVTTAGRPTPTYNEMVSVWCSADRKAAFSAAIEGQAPKAATCTNPIIDQFNLGLKLGVDGTPTIYGADGSDLGNYTTPDQLLQKLEKSSG